MVRLDSGALKAHMQDVARLPLSAHPGSTSRRPLSAAQAQTFISGASGLYSTAGDYWRFCQMLLDGGTVAGKSMLAPKTIAWMAQNHIGELRPFDMEGTGFGLGFAVVTEQGQPGAPFSKGTYFWGGSQGTLFWIDPAEQLIGILMVQSWPNQEHNWRSRFATLVYSSLVE